MPWIEVTPPEEAAGELREVYDEVLSRRGKLSNIMAIQSLLPGMIRPHLDLYMALMFSRSGLSRAEREMVAVHVSVRNGCEYCTRHHAEALKAYWKGDGRVEQLERGEVPENLSPREREMLAYAERLTREPAAVAAADVDRLREVGLSDADVLNLNAVVSYFNFVNRVAEGLGVEVSEEEMAGYRY